MVKFIIIRHGYSVFNKTNRFCGQYDVALDEVGYAQAESTGKYVLENYKIDKIYSSDLSRAIDTAKPVASALGLPIVTSQALREVDVGEWEGKTFEEVKAQYPDAYGVYKTNVGLGRCTGGESFAELVERIANELQRIAKENEGKTVLVSTHGGCIRALRCAWLHVPLEEMKNIPHASNASITVATYDNQTGEASFELIGYDGHLGSAKTYFEVV